MNRWFAVALVFGCGGVATVVVPPADDGGVPDASVADAGHDGGSATTDAGVPCGAVGPTWVCAGDGLGRQRCAGGQLELDPCARGCLRGSAGTDATCLGSSNVNGQLRHHALDQRRLLHHRFRVLGRRRWHRAHRPR